MVGKTFRSGNREYMPMEKQSVNILYIIWLIIVIGAVIEIVLGVLSIAGVHYWIIPDTIIGALLLIAMGILILLIAGIFATRF